MSNFNFMRVCLCIGALHSGGVLELWEYNGFICSLTDTFMFSFDVSFDKNQRFITGRTKKANAVVALFDVD